MSDHVTTLTARDNPLLVQLRKLARTPSAYRKEGRVWIEGEHLCSAFAARGGVAAQAVINDSGWQDLGLRSLALASQRVARVGDALFASISALESPARLGLLVTLPSQAPLLLPGVPSVVLDRVQDAGNVGSLLRSASAFGFSQVIALGGTAALWSPKVLRAGMGAHFGLHLVEGVEHDALAALSLPLLAADVQGDSPLDSAILPDPCAWVFGHEGQGVDAALLESCAQRLRIPQPGGEESLNVAAAAAICLYASTQRRRLAP